MKLARAILSAVILATVSLSTVEGQRIELSAAIQEKQKEPSPPTPKPKPTSTPKPDGRTDWNGTTSSDFNIGANWTPTGGTPGSAPPVAGDVAWLTSTPANKTINLSSNASGAGSLAGFYFSVVNGTGANGYNITSSSTSIKFTLTGVDNNAGTPGNETGNTNANAIRAENTTGTNTINAPIILGAAPGVAQYFYQARGGTLVINGAISSTNAIAGLQLRSSGSGTSTFTFAGANSYSGSTTIQDANIALNINNATALGSGGALIVTADVVLDNTSGSAITLTNNNPLTLSGGDLTFTGSNDLNFGTGAVSLSGNRTFAINAGTLTLGGNVSGTGTNTLTKAGPGTLVLNGTNGSYTGQTIITGGILSINSIKDIGVNSSIGAPTTSGNGRIDIGDTTTTGTLKYTGTGDSTNRGIRLAGSTGGATLEQSGTGLLKFTGTFDAVNGSKTLTLQGSTAGTGEISSAIVNSNGTVGLTKTGTGNWTLSGANTYTGGTIINQGTLTAAAGSLVSVGGGITVNNGGTLLLSGSGRHIGSAVGVALNGGTFNTGGLSEPGGVVNGTQFIGALTLSSSSTIDFGAGSSSILEFSGLGTHTASTILNITNWDGVPVVGGSGDRLLFNGLATSFVAAYNQNDVVFDGVTGYTAIQIATGVNGYYEVVGLSSVPEPGTWLAAALATFGLIGISRQGCRGLKTRHF